MNINDDNRILSYPIRQLAADLGLRKAPKMRDTYYAPDRDEKTPSLKLYPAKQRWRDYGAGEGGGLLDLILYCRKDLAAGPSPRAAAMEILKGLCGGNRYMDKSPKKDKPYYDEKPAERRILVENWQPGDDYTFTDTTLLEYAASRRWHPTVLRRYCRQIRISIKGTEHHHVMIGFPNIRNGYVLRGPGDFGKISTNQAVTLINAEGRFTKTPMTDTLLVFEGFGNFLARLSHRIYLGDNDESQCKPGADTLVLNSWQNIAHEEAQAALSAHRRIIWWGDDDKAGKGALEHLRLTHPDLEIEDMTGTYVTLLKEDHGHIDDYNDLLKAWCQENAIPMPDKF